MSCPNCDSVSKQQADSNKTTCLKCGETYQSGLQNLARRFDV